MDNEHQDIPPINPTSDTKVSDAVLVSPVVPEASNTAADTKAPLHAGTLMACLAYVHILVLIPLLTKRDDPFVLFHIKQGLVLLLMALVGWFIEGSLHFLRPLVSLVEIGLLVLSLIGIYTVIKQQKKPLPLVGHWAERIQL